MLSPRAQRAYLIDVNAAVAGDQLEIHFTYSQNIHQEQTLERLSAWFLEALDRFIDHSGSQLATHATPSDFPDVDIDQQQLDAILGRLGAGN